MSFPFKFNRSGGGGAWCSNGSISREMTGGCCGFCARQACTMGSFNLFLRTILSVGRLLNELTLKTAHGFLYAVWSHAHPPCTCPCTCSSDIKYVWRQGGSNCEYVYNMCLCLSICAWVCLCEWVHITRSIWPQSCHLEHQVSVQHMQPPHPPPPNTHTLCCCCPSLQ